MRSGIGQLLCVCTGKKPSGRNFPPQVNRCTSLCAESSGPTLEACDAAGDRTPWPTSGLARGRGQGTPSRLETLWTFSRNSLDELAKNPVEQRRSTAHKERFYELPHMRSRTRKGS